MEPILRLLLCLGVTAKVVHLVCVFCSPTLDRAMEAIDRSAPYVFLQSFWLLTLDSCQ